MFLNSVLIAKLSKIPCKNIFSLGSSHLYRSFQRKFMQQIWKDKTNEIIKNKGKIFLIEHEKGWEEISSLIYRDIRAINAVGFDCEWAQENCRRRPVALLQLATYSGNCVLFRLNNFQKIPSSLKDLLEDKSILKVGVSCDLDASYFTQDNNINVRGWLDLRYLAIEDDLKNQKLGLKSLAKHYLGKTMTKDWMLRASDWERETMTQEQVTYAAEDAIVGIRILLLQLKNLWTPVLEESWETSISKAIKEVCDPYVEVNFGVDKDFCYVCGQSEPAIKKSVVLQEYIKFFPRVLQFLKPDFIRVLLCNQCHEISKSKADLLKQKLAEECNAIIEIEFEQAMKQRNEALNACGLLRKRRNDLDSDEIRYQKDILKDYFQSNTLPKDLRSEARELQTLIANDICNLHGYKVFKYYEKIGLIHLMTRWREWFIDTMKPKYLPEYWSLSHKDFYSFIKTKMSEYPSDSDLRVGLKVGLVGTEGEIDVDSESAESDTALNNSDSNPDLNGEDSSQNFPVEQSIEQDYVKR